LIYTCCDELRRTVVTQTAGWNGIDFLEVLDSAAPNQADRQRFLIVHFVKPLGTLSLAPANVRIDGGERTQNIKVLNTSTGVGPQAHVLTVEVDRAGDFSIYTLRLVKDALSDDVPDGVDPRLAAIEFSFKVECPSPFDCAPATVCPPPTAPTPEIDYLAKDYGSFRRLMLDRMAVSMPAWQERNPADLGVALVEALAYSADQLSYQQDAVATEAYLRTARKRISVRRHARLMDYFVSEGCNARTWVYFEVSADVMGSPLIAKGTKLFTRIPGEKTLIVDDPRIYEKADTGFETMESVEALYLDHNELKFYTWSDQRCCLAQGATSATLEGHHPNLTPGMILLIEEVLGAETGNPSDADPTRRYVVRLAPGTTAKATDDTPLTDPVTGNEITEIVWDNEDALPFPFCLSAQTKAGYKPHVSVARGNLVLADHGLTLRDEPLGTVPEPYLFRLPAVDQNRCETVKREPIFPRFRPRLAQSPLTHAAPAYDHGLPARAALQWSLRDVQPALVLTSVLNSETAEWMARRDLLSSDATAEEFVAEIDNDGAVSVRFGDDRRGKRPEPGTSFTATYRVGNARSGNIGADTLAHIAADVSQIVNLRNPLPAQGGLDPESIEDVRQRAPVAYRVQERAVTPVDYAEVTERHSGVQRAAATFRWTGSWHTVFLTVDRSAGLAVTDTFETDIGSHVERYRMAGHDLEVDSPQFVALEITLHVCVAADHFRSDLEGELRDVLSNRDLADGRRGLFHPDNFTFGQPVYLSAIYAAAHQVPGVELVEALTFQRLGVPDNSALATGRLDIGRLEIARLDNDRNFAERGVLTLSLGGGK
jgi:uncharacterized phage protein gp47/JayE